MDKYFSEWNENTRIDWWCEGRIKLNVIIRMVNNWTLDGKPASQKEKILRAIDLGVQTFAAQGGGSAWKEELLSMQKYVQGDEQ